MRPLRTGITWSDDEGDAALTFRDAGERGRPAAVTRRTAWVSILAGLCGAGAIATRWLRRARQLKAQAERQAEELARLQTAVRDDHRNLARFLHSLVHEMRSPLTVIAGYADMLQIGDFFTDERGRQTALEAVLDKAEALNDIIEELLITARIEEGPIELQAKPVDLAAAVSEALRRIEDRARAAGAGLVTAGRTTPLWVAADAGALARILDNVLNNAFDHGGDQPQIEVTMGSDRVAWVRIRDHGPGVPELMHESIFDRFVCGRRDDHHHRTGLGLFVGRGLARQLRGELVLDWSRIGEGSAFVLRLPPAQEPGSPDSPASHP